MYSKEKRVFESPFLKRGPVEDSLSLHIIFMYLSYTVVLPFMRVCINGPVYISVVMPECMGY